MSTLLTHAIPALALETGASNAVVARHTSALTTRLVGLHAAVDVFFRKVSFGFGIVHPFARRGHTSLCYRSHDSNKNTSNPRILAPNIIRSLLSWASHHCLALSINRTSKHTANRPKTTYGLPLLSPKHCLPLISQSSTSQAAIQTFIDSYLSAVRQPHFSRA